MQRESVMIPLGISIHTRVKGKGSSLATAPLTILNSGAFAASEVAADWHWLYCTAAQASGCPLPALTDLCSQQAY